MRKQVLHIFKFVRGFSSSMLAFFSFLLMASLDCQAQTDFVDIDLNLLTIDSVIPHYSHSFPLGSNYQNIDYSISVEYPELVPLTNEETKRVKAKNLNIGDLPIIESYVSVCRREGFIDADFIPIVVRDGKYYKVKSFKWNLQLNPEMQLAVGETKTRTTASDSRYAATSVLSSGKWVKIKVADAGVYKLTATALRKMGFSDVSKVKLYGYGGNILPETNLSSLQDDLNELPAYHTSDGLLFYAYGTQKWTYNPSRSVYEHKNNVYSRYSYYFLTESNDGAPMSFVQEEAPQNVRMEISKGKEYSLYENDAFSWYAAGRKFFDSYEFTNNASKKYPFSLNNITSDRAYISVSYSAKASNPLNLGIQCDGKSIGTLQIPSVGTYEVASLAQSVFSTTGLSANSSVTLTHNSSTETGRLDYISVNYTRDLVMTGASMRFRNPSEKGNVRFRFTCPSDADIHVWRVSSPTSYSEIPVTMQGTECQIDCANSESDEYVALNVKGSFPSPTVVGVVENQNLHALMQADMIIIVPASGIMTSAANELAQIHREKDGLTVEVVSADKIYNEFSSGTPDATAYRRFLKMLYDRAKNVDDAPRYLLLFGDGVWDNRMVTSDCSGGNPDDYLLCCESDNSLSETDSYVYEDYFGLMDDSEGSNPYRDKTDIGVGRIPASSAKEASEVVEKIKRYMNNNIAGYWKNTICCIGDDSNENTHMDGAERVAQLVEQTYPGYRIERVFFDAYKRESSSVGYTYPMATQKIKDVLDAGALIMNYNGHGAPRQLSHESVLDYSDFQNMKSQKTPLWVTAACDVAPFDMQKENIGEVALLSSRGAIGFVGTTRTVFTTQNLYFNLHFTRHLLDSDKDGKLNTFGDAIRLTKNSLITSGSDLSTNKICYVLLGDPALRLNAPRYNAVIDSVNGVPASSQPEISAGKVVSVVGHVEDMKGNLSSDFSGTVYPVVYDCEETITTLNNDGSADEPFVYNDRTKRLFAGSDSVSAGKFSFRFPMPVDINYFGLPGQIVTCACSSDGSVDAHGIYDGMIIAKSSSVVLSDTIGPKVYAYLNYEDFPYGGKTNPTPYFVARLSDESGINAVGSSIGHDLELIIDNDENQTYVLNNYYESSVGDYTSGEVGFSIPELSEGPHKLLFRAWDVMNNSSTSVLEFNVVSDLKPGLLDVRLLNPASSTAKFLITTDRPNSQLSVRLEIFDFSGRKLFELLDSGESDGSTYILKWDLNTDSGRLLPGVYLYRVSVVADGATSAFKTDKFIVIRQ